MTVFGALLEHRRCQDGKCKSRTVDEGKFWELVGEMMLEMKSKSKCSLCADIEQKALHVLLNVILTILLVILLIPIL